MKLVNLLEIDLEILGIFWIHSIISGHIKIKCWMSFWRKFDPHFTNSPHVVLCTHPNWSWCSILHLFWIYPPDKCGVDYWAIMPTCLIICLLRKCLPLPSVKLIWHSIRKSPVLLLPNKKEMRWSSPIGWLQISIARTSWDSNPSTRCTVWLDDRQKVKTWKMLPTVLPN